jgi:ankyrin repeat protein
MTARPQPQVGTDAGWQSERRAEALGAPIARKRERPRRSAARLDRDLVDAAIEGDAEQVALLIRAGADVNAPLVGDGNALIVAARDGRVDIARRLLASGANVNAFVLYDETPLINAARAGHPEMVRFLLDHGADPNLAVPSGNRPGEMRSPLGMARDPAIADYLRRRGARS